ncbi:hypothetical protein GCM10025864_25530 [Luteimicrobium album]|uniref:RHS repeat-associated core domain-containing protein n=1 Tax=Luteimicrobium album TaxID=1054550 RepID=A0ABQ6I489_9MICO|nr:RHS repeat-associated core domain-containing protein [Luteimicrobium album]GMA24794.1 hypothetical protein GCM10025864_25530 [Luteimicrobium album]
MTVPTDGSTVQMGAVACFDEYGNQTIDDVETDADGYPYPGDSVTPVNTGALTYGYLGAKQRATDTTGLILMGARLFNPATGQFTSIDPVAGGNSAAYAYPQDPVGGIDLNGQRYIRRSVCDCGGNEGDFMGGAEFSGRSRPVHFKIKLGFLRRFADDIGDSISRGHAWTKHRSEFGFQRRGEMSRHVSHVIRHGEVRFLSNDRTAFYHQRSNTLVIHNPWDRDGGTVFRPTRGRLYFTHKLD